MQVTGPKRENCESAAGPEALALGIHTLGQAERDLSVEFGADLSSVLLIGSEFGAPPGRLERGPAVVTAAGS